MTNQAMLPIVDEHDNIVGYIPRDKFTNQQTCRIICVWIENSKGEVLLQQRSLSKKLGPGLWTCAVEGTVEGDDTYEQTAQREVAEEIGLTNFTLTPTKKLHYTAGHGARVAQGYKITCDWPIDKFTPQSDEVEQLAWRNKQQVIAELTARDPKYPASASVWLEMFEL